MEWLTDGSLSGSSLFLLVLSLAIACGFEFVNGFHDTANAVATVIYTNSLRPTVAVVWSGICNFAGVFLGGIGVAMGIVNLLPVQLLVSSDQSQGMAMVLALLLAAILWNLGTWFLGLPASSSHTLIGSILGVGIAHSIVSGPSFGAGVNWSKAEETGIALLLSPLIGFTLASVLLVISKKLIPNPDLYREPKSGQEPPGWIRGVLIATCSGVSLAHGSNDGQKGVGLIMLILIALLPGQYALNLSSSAADIETTVAAVQQIGSLLVNQTDPKLESVRAELKDLRESLSGHRNLAEVPKEKRFQLRADVLLIESTLRELEKSGLQVPAASASAWKSSRQKLRDLTEYAPFGAVVAVALSLGIGTMVGWKRIVVTVGEKIGKSHLTYAQGAAAEVTAMTTIGLSSFLGLPVSTTHVLSSGIAGTMVAQRSGLQSGTVRKIAMAWVLTLPASMLMSGLLYLVLRRIV